MAITSISNPMGYDDGTNGVRTVIKVGDLIGLTPITTITPQTNSATGKPIYYLMNGDIQLAEIFDSNGTTF